MDAAIFSKVLSAVTSAATAMAPRLSDIGITLLTSFGVITFSWRVTTGVLKETDIRGQLVGLLPLGITLSILAWLINDIGYLSKTLLDGFDWIAATVTGNRGGDPLSLALGEIMRVADAMWTSMGAAGAQGPSIMDLVKNTLAGSGSFWVKILTLVVLLFIAALTGAMFVMSQVLSGVAIALAPVFLPFYVLKQFSFLSTGWVKFFFTAGVTKVVGVVMLALAASLHEVTTEIVLAQTQAEAATVDLHASLAICFVAFVQLILAWQIPNIANGLVSGSVNASFDLSPATSVAGGAMRSVGHGYDGAKAGYGAAKAGAQKAAEFAKKFKK